MCAAALPWIIPTLLGVGTSLLMKPSKPKTPKLSPIEKPINTVETENTDKEVKTEQAKIAETTPKSQLLASDAVGKTSDLSTGISDPLAPPSGRDQSPVGIA